MVKEWEMFNIVDSADPHGIIDSTNTQAGAVQYAEHCAKERKRPIYVYVEVTKITTRKVATVKP